MRLACCLLALAMILLAGCGADVAPLPSDQEASAALRVALDAWKEGKKPDSLGERKPAIEAVDHEWVAGKALETYSIGSVTEEPGNITFAVTLSLKGATPPAAVRYMVFGKEPIHIYRDDDFARMSNMENGPATPKPRR